MGTTSARLVALVAAALFLTGCVASSADKSGADDNGMASPPASASSFTQASRAASSAAKPAVVGESGGVPVTAEAGHVPESQIEAVTAAGTPGSIGYQVGPLDVLDIRVFKVDELNQTVQVSESGKFGFPLVGEVRASGRTVSEIEKDLAAKLGGSYLRNPQVTVLVKDYNSHRITVDGSVKKPGVFPMQGPMTLLQVIATAGGVDEVADGTLVVFRRIGDKSAVAKFNMADLHSQKVDDPLLQAGDIVTVPSSSMKIGLQYIFRAVPLFNAFMIL